VNLGGEIVFITKDLKGNLINLLKDEFKTYEISSNNKFYKKYESERNDNEPYEKYIKSTQVDDASQTLRIIESEFKKEIDWIIIDHYTLDNQWKKFLENSKSKFLKNVKYLIIDDLINRKLNADIVLNQNFYSSQIIKNIEDFYGNKCKILIGPKFALLSKEYAKMHKKAKIRKSIKKVLIYFGGVDKKNYTLKVLEQMQKYNFANLTLFTILGQQNNNKNSIYKFASDKNNLKIFVQINTLSKLILESDLFIGSSGSTSWERACLGLPSMVRPISFDQIKIINELKNAKLTKEFNSWNFNKIFREFITNKELLMSHSSNNLNLTDGKGARRVALKIFDRDLPLKIRESKLSDENKILEWANEKSVRENSFSKSKISVIDHKKWFLNIKNDLNKYIFIISTFDEKPIAQTRFELYDDFFKIDFSIDKEFRGYNLAFKVLCISFLHLNSRSHFYKKIIAEVKSKNIPSIRTFEKLNFYKKIFNNKRKIFIFEFNLAKKEFIDFLYNHN